jgi:hypothetical protein
MQFTQATLAPTTTAVPRTIFIDSEHGQIQKATDLMFAGRDEDLFG